MSILLVVVMTGLGIIGSFFSGLLGIGGAIINFPLLLYIPPLFGLEEFTAHEVASISMLQVFFSSLSGILAYRGKGNKGAAGVIHKGLVLNMGISILAGSLIGSFVSGSMHGNVINLIYGILAVAAVILMLIPAKGRDGGSGEELHYSKAIAVGAAFIVGIVSGIVGAGGSFILIPVMLTVLRIPTRTAIASSMAIVFISAVGGVIGKLGGGDIPLWAALFTVIGSLIGAPIGARVGSKINVKALRYLLLILIAFTAVKVWSSIL
ncbi:sulfite exporter TauE/SafE family protein [Cohnella sp. AR92]|uniref:sulfite exporter TauE/SafE family protein n=1 Tax=Cohnella sp. AR92 TaxID=648716 RepID=UPI000F8F1476|nr:sulfite exporter TauE/SafE family protein [Cohnella sp. AR92]RUS45073.1 sulfite exporter TauE/SafE family protein [Cohnella sp. AR92]